MTLPEMPSPQTLVQEMWHQMARRRWLDVIEQGKRDLKRAQQAERLLAEGGGPAAIRARIKAAKRQLDWLAADAGGHSR